MITLMNQYFDDVRVNGYQAQIYSNAADGNFFGGHLYGVALMGYASFGDNPRAQEMIEWARIRFDGTPGSALSSSEIPLAWRTQVFDGRTASPVALDFNGPAITGNPFKGGFDFQGWSYGSEEFGRHDRLHADREKRDRRRRAHAPHRAGSRKSCARKSRRCSRIAS